MTAHPSTRLLPAAPPPLLLEAENYGTARATRLGFYIGYYILCAVFTAESFAVLLTIPMFAICCFNAWRIRSNRATPQDMIWFVLYMCFAIAPCQTLRQGYFDNDGPTSGLHFAADEIISAEAVVVLFSFVVTATTVAFSKKDPAGADIIVTDYELRDGTLPLILLLNLLGFGGCVFLLGGLGVLLSDRTAHANIDYFISPVLMSFVAQQAVTCLLACLYLKFKPQDSWTSSILVFAACGTTIALLLLAQNPYNAARFYLLLVWVPIGLLFCSGKVSVTVFYAGVFVGLLVLMPILSLTSRLGMSISEASQVVDVSEFFFKVPFLDVFDMGVYEVRFLREHDLYYWGQKTLSILFFFVPREIWAGKATLIAREMGDELVDLKTAGTENLSLFFAGEFYADLGFLGVAIGGFVLAVTLTVYGYNRSTRLHGLDLRSFIFMAGVPILIRGPIAAVAGTFFMQMVWLAVLTRLLGVRVEPPTRHEIASPTR